MRFYTPCYKTVLRYRTRFFFFFFNDTATTEIYTLSLHDALPISSGTGTSSSSISGVITIASCSTPRISTSGSAISTRPARRSLAGPGSTEHGDAPRGQSALHVPRLHRRRGRGDFDVQLVLSGHPGRATALDDDGPRRGADGRLRSPPVDQVEDDGRLRSRWGDLLLSGFHLHARDSGRDVCAAAQFGGASGKPTGVGVLWPRPHYDVCRPGGAHRLRPDGARSTRKARG